MKLKFTKMQGAGNDFVVLDGVSRRLELTPAQLRQLADRHFGVGCDQILLVEKPLAAGTDFRYRIFNADGGEVEQCGNGARCFVRFVRERGLTDKSEIRVETKGGIISPRLEPNGEVTVDMGAPVFEEKRVPFDVSGLSPVAEIPPGPPFAKGGALHVWPLEVDGKGVEIVVVSMGNPHAVQLVADVEAAPVLVQGPLFECHARFPQRVNTGYMQVVDRGHIRLRVFERGSGETLACGTGACAAVAVGIRRGLLDARVRVSTHGGDLTIRWEGADNSVWMTGPAVTVFEGEIDL